MAYFNLYANHFRSYEERPNTATSWKNLISSNPYLTFYNGYIYQWEPDGSTQRNSATTHGYICFGNNENNSSFDVFYVATTDTYGMGPFMFNMGSGTSKAADWAGTDSRIGHWGVWKVGTISASSRVEAKIFNDFVMIALRNDPNNGYMADDSITVSSALREAMQNDTKAGAVYSGCYDITASATVASTVTMGKTAVTFDASITGSPTTKQLTLTTLDGVTLNTVNGTSLSWNAVLPYTLEQYFMDNELRRQTNLKITMQLDSNKPVFINGKWQSTGISILELINYIFESDNFYLQIDSTRLPTFTSIEGTKDTNHNSKYVMLVNGYDKINFAATVKDQSYPYNNNPSNYAPVFALYCGDANLGNYRPASVSSSGNTLTTTYNGSWGPITVNPPVSLGTNQTFSVVYQDRFGRQASSNLSIVVDGTTVAYQRFYNYTNPTWSLVGQRVNSSGTPDDRNGTYIKIDYNWALSLLDYSLSPHTGTNRPTIKITNNQDTSVHNYTITTDSGTNTFTVSNKPLDKSYTFTAVLTDAAGRTYSLSCFVPSGEVFMDFMAGGSGLGIGKRAEAADTLSIGWDTEIKQDLKVDGNIIGPTITDIYNKIPGAVTSLPASSITVASPLNSSLGANVQLALASLNSSVKDLEGQTGGGGVNIYMTQNQPLRWRWIVFDSTLSVSGDKFAIGFVSHVTSSSSYFVRGTSSFTATIPITLPSGFSSINVFLYNGLTYKLSSSSSPVPNGFYDGQNSIGAAPGGLTDIDSHYYNGGNIITSISTGSTKYSYLFVSGFVACTLT